MDFVYHCSYLQRSFHVAHTSLPCAHADLSLICLSVQTWSKYVKKLGDFAKPENIDFAVQCLNELITNALHHIPDVITYLSRLRNQSIFNFCAIPQVRSEAPDEERAGCWGWG